MGKSGKKVNSSAKKELPSKTISRSVVKAKDKKKKSVKKLVSLIPHLVPRVQRLFLFLHYFCIWNKNLSFLEQGKIARWHWKCKYSVYWSANQTGLEERRSERRKWKERKVKRTWKGDEWVLKCLNCSEHGLVMAVGWPEDLWVDPKICGLT